MIEELWNSLIQFSATFVVPDWGKLVGLIPLGLAAIVGLYVTWIVFRFATAGPTRRGRRRLPPATPAGIHMPGPSFAPLIAAVGLLFLVIGMVSGGLWLLIGLLILAIALLYWGREEMRDFDRATSTTALATTGFATGALPAPRGAPPAGVHIPPPSFRPLLIAVAATILVVGMVIGGWALAFGVIALAVVLLGWLRDARREYGATERADATGHLDLGGAPSWPTATFAALALLVAAGLLLSSGILGGPSDGTASASGGPAASAAAGGGTAPSGSAAQGGSAAPAASLPPADATVTAQGINWVETTLTIPAGKPFKLAFDNRDAGVAHDVVIKGADGAEVYRGELVTGPAVVVYDVPAIPAGQYQFVCTVHPNMQGTVTAQ
jgi:plastocyanin